MVVDIFVSPVQAALQCAVPTGKGFEASKWSKVKQVCLKGQSVTATELHILPEKISKSSIAILVGMSDGQIRVAHVGIPVKYLLCLRYLCVCIFICVRPV